MNWNGASIRRYERESIADFIEDAGLMGYLAGRVLDVGCGQQPYRDIVEHYGGEYHGYDSPRFAGSTVAEPVGTIDLILGDWDVVMTTQVIQYVEDPLTFIQTCHGMISDGGWFVITWPTCWDEIEDADCWRFTLSGMKVLLDRAGFKHVTTRHRACVAHDDFRFFLGGGAWAQR